MSTISFRRRKVKTLGPDVTITLLYNMQLTSNNQSIPGGTRYINKVGMLVENFEIGP